MIIYDGITIFCRIVSWKKKTSKNDNWKIVIIGIQDIIKKENLNLYDGDKEKQFYGLKSYDIQKPSWFYRFVSHVYAWWRNGLQFFV